MATKAGPQMSGSKAAFYRTMKNHPERLKGKTVDEAYAGMRRNVRNIERFNSKKESGGGRQVSQAAVARRLQNVAESRNQDEPRRVGGRGFSPGVKVPSNPLKRRGFGKNADVPNPAKSVYNSVKKKSKFGL